MPESVLVAIISAVVALGTTLIAAVLTQRGNLKQAAVEHRAAPYEALALRVERLEAQVEQLEAEIERSETARSSAIAYARRLRLHIVDQLPPPPPDWPADLGIPI